MLHTPGHAHQAQHVERHEREIEADQPAPERGLAPAFVEREAERLGKPISVACHHAEHDAADDDVVEMRHQEQAVVQLEIGGGTAISTPVMPPMTNVTMKPSDHSTGTVKRTRPPYIVNSQLKTLTPVGTAMIMIITPKKPLTSALAPMVKKWCSQTRKERTQITMVAATIER